MGISDVKGPLHIEKGIRSYVPKGIGKIRRVRGKGDTLGNSNRKGGKSKLTFRRRKGRINKASREVYSAKNGRKCSYEDGLRR